MGENKENYELLQNKFKTLTDLVIPQVPKRKKSIFEIAGYAHYEIVYSNILAFYLDKNEDHNFGSLFLDSLLELVEQKKIKMMDWNIERERATENNNFIDILVTGTFGDEINYLIIENKIWHSPTNPFIDYWKSINAADDNKLGIILSLDKINEPIKNFTNILHSDLLDKVISNLQSCFIECDDRHLLILKDFYLNLKILKGESKDMNDQLKFYLANGEKFEQLNNLRREIIDNLSNNIKNLKFATIENGRKGQSNDKLKVYNYIDDNGGNGKIWVTIDLKEFLSKKSIEFQISCYTREINFDEIINSNDFKKSVKDNSIDIIPIKRYKWGDKILSKKYHYVADSKISVQDWIMDIYNVDWLPVIKQINLILKYVN